ncbi:SapB/AmfS family lanthipeptide [Streptomyces sp. TRM 70361]|uniref:SapB/AmfS family lanthipeptide n=1 Tax=Streptomyces sp. TRM 70361 TaxID=3116553 RepID=UPI002E7AD010|nr:SapB/AmfS family lanthipeptide [Streptomyces sp. TRM 70361]MEE1939108.1 SapB/AmfS family lanthipeptide [Streptomyces sp. TRM 70361]
MREELCLYDLQALECSGPADSSGRADTAAQSMTSLIMCDHCSELSIALCDPSCP